MKEIIRMFPFSSLILRPEPKQQMAIKIVESLNNHDFVTSSIEFMLANNAPQFTKAVVRVTVALFGIRYMMKEYFLSFALFVIGSMTSSMMMGSFIFYRLVKDKIKKFIDKLYPEKQDKSKKLTR